MLQRLGRHAPQRTALLCCDGDDTTAAARPLDYGWLQRAAARLTARLETVVEKGDAVGLCFGATTAGAVVGMLAAEAAGCPFLPMDGATQPLQRLCAACHKARVGIVLCDATAEDKALGLGREGACREVINVSDVLAAVDADGANPNPNPNPNPNLMLKQQ